jgi:hypothetical protein
MTHQSQEISVLSRANPKTTKREASHLPGELTLELAPTLSLLAIEGWACSNSLLKLSKEERA